MSRVIEGLKVEVKGSELAAIALASVKAIEREIEEETAKESKLRDLRQQPGFTDVVGQPMSRINGLRGRSEYLRFVADHVVKDAVYLINSGSFYDLTTTGPFGMLAASPSY